MNRRDVVLATAAGATLAPAFAAAPVPGVTDGEILLGQSAVLSGPLSPGVLALQGGARIALEEANAGGGVNRRRIKLVSLDDGFDAGRARANYRALVEEQQVFACMLGVGAQTTLAALPLLKERNVPLIAPTAVVDSAREKSEGVAYYTRASQQRESDALAAHFGTLGLKRVALAYLATPGGQEVLGQVQAAAEKHGLTLVGSAPVAPDGSDAADAGRALAASNAQVVVLFLSGAPAATLIRSVWARGASPSFYGMSILAGDVTMKLLGQQSRGLAISQVTPYPWDAANADANRYRKACEKAQLAVGYHSYEGYLAGRIAVEALRQAGRELTRERLHEALRKLKLTVGGMDVDFSQGRNTGSRFIELVSVRQDGKYVR
jgi:ABC-type branched-subunit amino acid transport system substrate-binding protein